MAHYLLSDQIIFKVLSLLRDDKPTLATCAQVHSIWAEASLDLLWERVEDVEDLLSIFPRYLSTRDGYPDLPTLEEEDLVRFRYYSTRVRQLSPLSKSITPRQAKGLRAAILGLGQEFREQAILPRLQGISCHEQMAHRLAIPFLHPGLTAFECTRFPLNRAAYGQVITNIRKKCFNLNKLHVSVSRAEDFCTPAVSTLIPMLQDLRDVRITCPLPGAGAGLQTLEVLWPTWVKGDLRGTLAYSCERTTLAEVTDMVCHWPGCAQLLSVNIEIDLSKPFAEDGSDLIDFLDVISSRVPLLGALHVSSTRKNREAEPLSWSRLYPYLSRFSTLECLTLGGWHQPIAILSGDLVSLKDWKSLECLTSLGLGGSTMFYTQPEIGLDELLDFFAEHCPRLERLSIFATLDEIEDPSKSFMVTPRFGKLGSLRVNRGMSEIPAKTRTIARYLASMLPLSRKSCLLQFTCDPNADRIGTAAYRRVWEWLELMDARPRGWGPSAIGEEVPSDEDDSSSDTDSSTPATIDSPSNIHDSSTDATSLSSEIDDLPSKIEDLSLETDDLSSDANSSSSDIDNPSSHTDYSSSC